MSGTGEAAASERTAASSTPAPLASTVSPAGSRGHPLDRVIITQTLAPGLEAAAQAREAVRGLLRQRRLPDLSDTACLLTSELVANATIHGGAPVELTVDLDQERLEVEVGDPATGVPQLHQPTTDDTGGRGLDLVARLADDWGIRHHRDGGKSVWFALRVARP